MRFSLSWTPIMVDVIMAKRFQAKPHLSLLYPKASGQMNCSFVSLYREYVELQVISSNVNGSTVR